MSAPDAWLSAPEVAKELGITTRRVYGLVDAGSLPFQRRGRRIEFHAPDVEKIRLIAAELAEEQRDREGEKRRALDFVADRVQADKSARIGRDNAIVWCAREHGASLREIADATGLPPMTIKRIIDRAS
jgi:excisionase family DNA binding protein